MPYQELIPVSKAASRLGVSPRRVLALIHAGEIEADRIGRQWLLKAAGLERYAALRPPRGRPLSPRRAWALLFLLSGEQPSWIEARDRSELRHHLRDRPPARLAPRVRSRARLHLLRAHPGDLARVELAAGLVRSGGSAASEYGLDLLVRGQLEGYLPADRFESLSRDFHLRPSDNPNVWLRVVEAFWPFDADARFAPPAAAAVDLLQADDERSRGAGRELLRRVRPP